MSDKSHHNVYVVLLDPVVGGMSRVIKQNPRRDPRKPCLYVGMTGLTPEERFKKHKKGIKDSTFVRNHGKHLIQKLYEHLNPMSYEEAVRMEKRLAANLRRQGYTVTGGH